MNVTLVSECRTKILLGWTLFHGDSTKEGHTDKNNWVESGHKEIEWRF